VDLCFPSEQAIDFTEDSQWADHFVLVVMLSTAPMITVFWVSIRWFLLRVDPWYLASLMVVQQKSMHRASSAPLSLKIDHSPTRAPHYEQHAYPKESSKVAGDLARYSSKVSNRIWETTKDATLAPPHSHSKVPMLCLRTDGHGYPSQCGRAHHDRWVCHSFL